MFLIFDYFFIIIIFKGASPPPTGGSYPPSRSVDLNSKLIMVANGKHEQLTPWFISKILLMCMYSRTYCPAKKTFQLQFFKFQFLCLGWDIKHFSLKVFRLPSIHAEMLVSKPDRNLRLSAHVLSVLELHFLCVVFFLTSSFGLKQKCEHFCSTRFLVRIQWRVTFHSSKIKMFCINRVCRCNKYCLLLRKASMGAASGMLIMANIPVVSFPLGGKEEQFGVLVKC